MNGRYARRQAWLLTIALFSFLGTTGLRAEGTRQLNPTAGDQGRLQIWDNNDANRNFMTFGCPANRRLYIHISDPSERIYYGFLQTDNDVYYRIMDPLGNPVVSAAGNGILCPVGGAGRITTYNSAVIGPQQRTGGAGGYNALFYQPTMAGDYYIEFNARHPSIVAANRVKRTFTYLDVTVTDAGNNEILGRLWSQQWDINMMGGNNRFNATMFIYADDGVVTSLDFNGIQPFGFVISSNQTGCTNTGNVNNDRRSRNGNVNFPQYRLFLNNPDTTQFPTGTLGSITSSATLTGCTQVNRCINVEVDQPGSVDVLLNFNGIPGYQNGSSDLLLQTTVAAGLTCLPWDGLDGLGNLVPSGTNFEATVFYRNGLTHLPLFDVERHTNGYIVQLFRPAGPNPNLFWDDSQLPAGTTELNGATTPPGQHTWTSNYGNNRTMNTWWFASVDSNTTILSVVEPIDVDADSVSAGQDTTVCLGGATAVDLRGQVQNAGGGTWSTLGTGIFNPNTPTGRYEPSAADISSGSVNLVLTTTGNGACPPRRDTVRIAFPPTPAPNAGPDRFVCANNSATTIAGASFGATGAGVWSSATGTGTFFPHDSVITTTYTPDAGERASGLAILVLTTRNNNICPIARDTMVIIIDNAPVVNAGPDNSFCRNATYTMQGSFSGSSGVQWISGGGYGSVTNPTTVFTPSAAQISAGFADVILETTGNGSCLAERDTARLTLTPAPVVNAGNDLNNVCANTPGVNLNGSVSAPATGGQWTTLGSGTFSGGGTALNAQYFPSNADTTAGFVRLVLTSTGNGTCNPVRDTMQINFRPAPRANAGADLTRCRTQAPIPITGTIANATGGNWTALNGGGFTPTSAMTSGSPVNFTPSASEITAGFATLVLTTTGTGGCPVGRDTMAIILTPPPTVSAANGLSGNVCRNNPSITLNGTYSAPGTSSNWTTSGDGSFNFPAQLNATYTLGANDLSAGTVTLTLTVNGGGCAPVVDNFVLNVTPTPTVDAGANQTVCANNPTVTLSGSVLTATGGQWSTETGNGTFTPSTSLNTSFTASFADTSAGSVKVYLTTTGNGNCTPVRDSLTVFFAAPPRSDAGIDQTVCANTNPLVNGVVLDGAVTPGVGYNWTTTGTGVFSPNNTVAAPNYQPSVADTTAGSVDLILLTTNNGDCNPARDTMTIFFTPAPVVNPGPNQSICSDNPTVTLSGTVSAPATGGQWTGGAGTFGSGSASLTTTYTALPAEVSAGSLTLTLTSTGNGTCNPENRQTTITFTPGPTVNAGADVVLCGATPNLALNGVVTVATGGTWTTSGTGTFNTPSSLTATYTPSAADRTAGSVTLTLTTTGNGTCNARQDQMLLSFQAVPTVNAGPDQTVCSNSFPVQLNASGSPGSWNIVSGTGALGTPTAQNSTYAPSAGDLTAGSVTLAFVTNGGACPSLSDTVVITLLDGPTLNAGVDQTVCADTAGVQLSAITSFAPGIRWQSSGNGTFVDSLSTATVYNLSAGDISTGSVNLIAVTTGVAPCAAARDTVRVSITPAVIAFAGPDRDLCADQPTINLVGVVQNATGGQWSGGTPANYSPGTTSLTPTYTFTAADRTAGFVQVVLTSTGNGICRVQRDTALITLTPVPTVSAGPDDVICASSTASLNGTFAGALGVEWYKVGASGGVFSPSFATEDPIYTPSATDTAAGTIRLEIVTTGNGTCNAVRDTMTLSFDPVPVITVGPDAQVCADAGTYMPTATFANAGGVLWTSSGTGGFNNNTLASPTYTISSADSLAGGVSFQAITTANGSCQPDSDQVILTITPVPRANAGPDLTYCADIDSLPVNGSVLVATGGAWSTTGTGTFTNASNLSTFYSPSSADTLAGVVQLVLTTTGNGLCNPVTDTTVLTFTPVPTLTVSGDQTVCADTAGVSATTVFSVSSTVEWTTSGSGAFFPNNVNPATTYVPSVSDTISGSIYLIATTTDNGTCQAVSDSLLVTITPVPVVDAGFDQTRCADVSGVILNGSVVNATGGTWTTSGSGSFSLLPTDLGATYIPSAADTAVGTVTLTLTSTGNGTCRAYTDQMIITLTDAPTANAGPDQTLCASTATVSMTGSVTTATGGTWSSAGTGFFNTPVTNLANSYTVSSADTAAGSVRYILTTTGNGLCQPARDTMFAFFEPVPVVNAGPDDTTCQDVVSVALTGTVANDAGATWTASTGLGSFSPNATTLSTSYVITGQSGNVTLRLTSDGAGVCPPVADSMQLVIRPRPVVDAGIDDTICADAENYTLVGSISNADGGYWTRAGTGNIADSTMLTTTYTPSAADISNGSVVFTLTTTGNRGCNSYVDTKRLFFRPVPTLNAGPDIQVCKGTDSVQVTANITNAGGYWDSFGSGTWSLSQDNVLNYYRPSVADTTAGSVTLFITLTGTGVCNPVNDQLVLTFIDAPVINAGPDTTICSNTWPITLQGSGAPGRWSVPSGVGTFAPHDSVLNATYTPALSDIGDTVMLVLSSINNGACPPTRDTVIFSLPAGPSVDILTVDTTICADAGGVLFPNVTVTNSAGVLWTSSGSGGYNNNMLTNPTYTPSVTDISDSVVTLTISTTGNVGCSEETDQVTLYINPEPTVNAGTDQTVCADVSSVNLSGSFTLAGGIVWSSPSGGAFSGGGTSPVATYTPTVADTTAGFVDLVLSTTGNGLCQIKRDTVRITFTPAPTINIGPDDTICASQTSYALSANFTVATGVSWSGNGTGTFTPGITNPTPTYNLTNADTTAGEVRIIARTTGNGGCQIYRDTMFLRFERVHIVNAGIDQSICGQQDSVTMAGVITNSTGGTWTTFGTGAFSVPNTDLAARYFLSPADKSAGSVTLQLASAPTAHCPSRTDQMVVNITAAPTVDAGLNLSVCEDFDIVQLTGSISGAGGGLWTTTNGTGNFSSATSLTPTYTPVLADRALDTLYFYLETTGNGLCLPALDSVKVALRTGPTINAGPNDTICADNTSGVQLNGSVTVASGGVWNGGNGTYAPSRFQVAPRYFLSPSDTALGQIDLYITSTGNGDCKPVTDTMRLVIDPAPVVNAGPNQTLCVDVDTVYLSATIANAAGGLWTRSGSGTFTSAVGLTTRYVPSTADRNAGFVNLFLSSTGNGRCNSVTDTVRITFTPRPTVNAGPDRTVCADVTGVPMTGSVTVATGGTWTTLGSGIFTPNPGNLTASYVPSTAERNSAPATVDLVLTTTGNGTCQAYRDTLTLTITPRPIVDAGSATLCADIITGVVLSGSVTNASGGTWMTSGTGVFAPNPNTLTPRYFPSPADFTAGSVTLTLTSTGNGTCNAYADNQTLIITALPTANAGPDRIVCRNSILNLTPATIQPGVTYQWFDGSTNLMSGNLLLSFTASQDTTLVVEATDNKGCSSYDTAQVVALDQPTFAMPDDTCLYDGLVVDAMIQTTPPVVGDFQWYLDGFTLFGQTDSVIVPVQSGDYAINYTIGFCSAQDTIEIFDVPVLVTALDRIVCQDSVTNVFTSLITGAMYSWEMGAPVLEQNSFSVTATNATFTDTIINVQVTDINGCIADDSVRVTTYPTPNPDLVYADRCDEDTLFVNATPANLLPSDTVGGVYTWFQDGATIANTQPTFAIVDSGQYVVRYQVDECYNQDTLDMDFFDLIVPDFLTPVNFCEDTVTISAGTADFYEWISAPVQRFDPPVAPIVGSTNQTVMVNIRGDYDVVLTADYGIIQCPDTHTVVVTSRCVPTLFYPNAITPENGRGQVFQIFGRNAVNIKLTVFNRWGEIIFFDEAANIEDISPESNPSSEWGWDGTYKGEIMQVGVYPFLLEYEGDSEEFKGPYKKEGRITVVR